MKEAIEKIMKSPYFAGKQAPMVGDFQPGEGKVFIVTGENATGKSFFSRIANLILKRDYNLAAYRVGMDYRTGSGVARCFVFSGDENEDSTGVLSINAIQGGLRTCQKHDQDHFMIFDEPDIGLSESYQGAVGKLFAKFAGSVPERTKLFVVVTHSRRIVRQLLPLKPHHVRIGDKMTLAEFMADPPDKEIEDLDTLQESARDLYCKISKEIDKVRKAKGKT